MALNNRVRVVFFIFFMLSFYAVSDTDVPRVESILQKGFSEEIDILEQTKDALMSEYQSKKNVASLIFYSYGMLKLANKFGEKNDFVKASEYAKLGFFYLDEAVDLYGEDTRVRYFRARVDAYLPAEIGRCVVTLEDTEILLGDKNNYHFKISDHIKNMRYRAFYNCKEYQQADDLLRKIKAENARVSVLPLDMNTTPEWDINEVTQIIVPLIKEG